MNDHSSPVGSVMFRQKIRKRLGLFFVSISFPESALLYPAERSLSLTKRIAASGNEIDIVFE